MRVQYFIFFLRTPRGEGDMGGGGGVDDTNRVCPSLSICVPMLPPRIHTELTQRCKQFLSPITAMLCILHYNKHLQLLYCTVCMIIFAISQL